MKNSHFNCLVVLVLNELIYFTEKFIYSLNDLIYFTKKFANSIIDFIYLIENFLNQTEFRLIHIVRRKILSRLYSSHIEVKLKHIGLFLVNDMQITPPH